MGEGNMWYETSQKMKQGQAWDWSRAEAQEWERSSGQTCFQKVRELKCGCVGGLSLEMENRVEDSVR